MPTIAEQLKKANHFAALTDSERAALAAVGKRIDVAKGQLLFSRGEPAEFVYLIKKGSIAIERVSMSGRSVRVATLGPGAVFGELGAIDGLGRSANARALGASAVIALPRTIYCGMLESNAAFAAMLIRDLAAKLRQTDAQIEDISLRSLKSRLAELLYEVGAGAAAPANEIRITQAELADRLSATREKVNAHLQLFQETGAISLSRARITFIDLEKLRAFFH